ncbi:UNVERIFIED_CONTAM: hypothetical protein Sangu_0025900 [Sesamum angustifolium]|uniref:Uncharacterized protein n=1 Tax=Sesamum angustifolium TaxID=2727405 RepID=A0AAW2RJC6_9LAMI
MEVKNDRKLGVRRRVWGAKEANEGVVSRIEGYVFGEGEGCGGGRVGRGVNVGSWGGVGMGLSLVMEPSGLGERLSNL